MKKRKVALMLTAAIGATIIHPAATAQSAVYNGWEKSGEGWYYYSSGQKCTGWVKDNGTWYYLESNGTMKTGWLMNGGNWYYLKDSGAMAVGWVEDDEKWYYLNEQGAMKTGWLKYNDKWYYLNADGSMKIGWLNLGEKLYYLGEDGAMRTGWFSLYDDFGESVTSRYEWYYANEDGSMKFGWLCYNGQWYYIEDRGCMQRNRIIDGYYVNREGIWDKSFDNKITVTTTETDYDIEEYNIEVSIVNLTDNSCEYDRYDRIIQQYKDNKWITVSEDYASTSANIENADKKSIKWIQVPLSDIKNQPEAGIYRVGVKINGEYVYGEFKLTGEVYEQSCVMTLEKTSYPVGTNYIPYTITNMTDRKFGYNHGGWIQKLEDGEWKSVPSRDVSVDQEYFYLKGKSSFKDGVSLYEAEEELTKGKYRIVRSIGGHSCYAEFELTGEKEPFIVMKSEQKVYTKGEDKKVKFTIQNNTGEKLTYYNEDFRIDKWNADNKEWEYVSLKDSDYDFSKDSIEAGDTGKCEILLDGIEDSVPGKYRIVKYLGEYTGIAEFEIK